MKYSIKLRVIDPKIHGYGEFLGFMPEEVYLQDGLSRGFDPFFTPDGLYHDLFEHWFEGVLSWATPFSLWNEMVASGAGWALYYWTGLNNFKNRQNSDRNWIADTRYELEDYLNDESSYDYSVLKYNIPWTKTDPWAGTYSIDSDISEYEYIIHEKFSKNYLKKMGVTARKIENAYYVGINLVESWLKPWNWNSESELRSKIRRSFENTFNLLTDAFSEKESIYIMDDRAYGLKNVCMKACHTKEGLPNVKFWVEDELNNKFSINLLT